MASIPTIAVIVWVFVYRTKNGKPRSLQFTNKQKGKNYRDKLIRNGFEIISWGILTILLFFCVDCKVQWILNLYPHFIQAWVTAA